MDALAARGLHIYHTGRDARTSPPTGRDPPRRTPARPQLAPLHVWAASRAAPALRNSRRPEHSAGEALERPVALKRCARPERCRRAGGAGLPAPAHFGRKLGARAASEATGC